MTATKPRIRWMPQHFVLKRQLQRYKWSLDELRWLQTHARGLPPDLEALIRMKIAAAESEERRP